MKVKSDFVTNSSSCTYIMVAYSVDNMTSIDLLKKVLKIDDLSDLKNKWGDAEDIYCDDIGEISEEEIGERIDVMEGSDYVPPGHSMLVGIKLADYIGYQEEGTEIIEDLDEINRKVKKIGELLELEGKPKLFISDRVC